MQEVFYWDGFSPHIQLEVRVTAYLHKIVLNNQLYLTMRLFYTDKSGLSNNTCL